MASNQNPDVRVYQQIERTADYYEPAIYELLTFYSSTQFESDELDGQFIPVTTVPYRSPQQVKIFAVGVLPPSSNVTQRLIDRSASVAAAGNPVDANNIDPITGKQRVTASGTPIPVGPTSTNSPEFFAQYVAMCNRLGCQPEELAKVINSESGFQASAKNVSANGHVNAQGLNQLSFAVAVPNLMDQATWDNFSNLTPQQQLPFIQKYYGGRIAGKTAAQIYAVNAGGFNNPDGSIYNLNAAQLGYANPSAQVAGYNGNKIFDRTGKGYITPEDLAAKVVGPLPNSIQARIDAARAALGMSKGDPQAIGGDGDPSTKWQTSGAKNSNQAQKDNSKAANHDFNRTDLGLQFLAAQQAEITATLEAIDRMQKTPPLRMLVNPQSFRNSSEKIIADGNWGRNGPIIEHWGEAQDKIEGSGKLAAFYAIDVTGVPIAKAPNQPSSNLGSAGNGPGLGRTARQFSQSYQNFLGLWLLYKNNGGVWLRDFINTDSSRPTNLSVVGSIYIYYDDILYLGSFDSFNITESETAPFTLEYNFAFTVRASFLLDRTDAQNLSYGAPPIVQGNQNVALTQATVNPLPFMPNNNPQPAPDVAPAPANRRLA